MDIPIREIDSVLAAEQHLRALINNTGDPIWLVDTDLTILECNQAFRTWVRNFIGHELDRGDHVLFNGLHKSYLEKFEMCYKFALNGNAFQAVEDMWVGDMLTYTAVNFQPVFGAAGEITSISCYARDITEQRRHLHKIEQQNNALRDIAFMESHKLRRPLANIIGLHDLFNFDDLADPLNRELMEVIGLMSKELDHIVREVVRKTNEV
jgi:PAS domain S-box-containing protein